MKLSYFVLFTDLFRFSGPSGIHGLSPTIDLSEVNSTASRRTTTSPQLEVPERLPKKVHLPSRMYVRRRFQFQTIVYLCSA